MISEAEHSPSRHSLARPSLSGESDVPRRYVLIGGPGQGKTTLGQFVCQLYRAALLDDVDRAMVDSSAGAVVREIVDQWRIESIPRPRARRIPVRIVLSEFAKALAEKETHGVLDYLAQHVAARTRTDFGLDDIRVLLSAYPSVVMFDGLDEVPPSTNRDDVLECIRDFQVEIATERMNVLIVATSRPQGYNDDFSPQQYRHLYLVPLSTEIALDYGRRLTRIRFGHDVSRHDKVVQRLVRAASSRATMKLMRSPLQVTIMTLLVDRMGQPPQERWALFNAYYNLIYQREIEREIPAAAVLRDHRPDIDAIHQRVGLVLQVESELISARNGD